MTEQAHRVLLVDDEFAALEVLALLLGAEGLDVVMASNGEEALLRLAEATVDLVITDYKMPKMDGAELCRKMLADVGLQSIPVILTSATYRRDVPRPSNVVVFFSKPLLFRELLEAVHTILGPHVTPPNA